MIENQLWPANKIGLLGLGSIEKEGVDFDALRRLNELPLNDKAGTCFIFNEGDKTVPSDRIDAMYKAAEKAGFAQLILGTKRGGSGDPHFDDPLDNPEVLEKYFSFLIRKK